jgi:hypothetical protein
MNFSTTFFVEETTVFVGTLALVTSLATMAGAQGIELSTPAAKDFKGVIKLDDILNSAPDWEPHIPNKTPGGAPNILFILYDDTGFTT